MKDSKLPHFSYSLGALEELLFVLIWKAGIFIIPVEHKIFAPVNIKRMFNSVGYVIKVLKL